jgi:hypothetical protein
MIVSGIEKIEAFQESLLESRKGKPGSSLYIMEVRETRGKKTNGRKDMLGCTNPSSFLPLFPDKGSTVKGASTRMNDEKSRDTSHNA